MAISSKLVPIQSPNRAPIQGDAQGGAQGDAQDDAQDDARQSLEDLLQRAKAQDMQAWEAIYAQTFDALYRRLRFLTGDASTAEELTQEAYVQAMLSIGDFRAESSFTTWLSAVALNLVRKHWRRQGARKRAHAGLSLVKKLLRPGGDQPEADLVARHEEEHLRAAVEELPVTLREVFVLRYLEGVPCPEVAVMLEISENNVSVRAHRSRTRVREILQLRGVLGDTPEQARWRPQ